VSRTTLEVNRLLAGLSTGMGTPPFEFIYRVVGLEIPSPMAREVTERLALLWKLHHERDAAKQKTAERNGQHANPRES
jgi:hypothetical protein